MRVKKLTVPLYGAQVYFCIEPRPVKVISWVDKTYYYLRHNDKVDILSAGTEACACPLFIEGEPAAYLLWLRSFNSTGAHWNTVSHELVHIKNYIWTHIGHENDIKFDEVEAYLVGWLTEEFVKFLRSK